MFGTLLHRLLLLLLYLPLLIGTLHLFGALRLIVVLRLLRTLHLFVTLHLFRALCLLSALALFSTLLLHIGARLDAARLYFAALSRLLRLTNTRVVHGGPIHGPLDAPFSGALCRNRMRITIEGSNR